MSCEISKKIAKDNIRAKLDLIGKKFDLELKHGEIIKSSESYFPELQKELDTFAVLTSLYDLTELGGYVLEMTINAEPSQILIDSIEQTAKGQQTDIEKADYDKNNYKNISLEYLVEQFDEKKNELRDFLANISVALSKGFDIGKGTKLYENVDVDTLDQLKSLQVGLSKSLVEDDFQDQVKFFLDYLIEVNVISKNLRELITKLEKDKEGYVKINELVPLIQGHEKIIKEIAGELRNAPADNEIVKLINQTVGNMNSIDDVLVKVGLEFNIDQYSEVLEPIALKMQKEMEAEIARLNALKLTATNKAQLDVYDRKIREKREEYESGAPTKENILKIFKGDAGDISIITSYIRAGITNPDFIISGFSQMVKDAHHKSREDMVKKRNNFQSALDEYQQESGEKISNVQTFFKRFLEERRTFYFDRGTNTIQVKKAIQRKSYYDPRKYGQQSLIRSASIILRNAIKNNIGLGALNIELWDGEHGLEELNEIVKPYKGRITQKEIDVLIANEIEAQNADEKQALLIAETINNSYDNVITDVQLSALELNINALRNRWETENYMNTYTDEYYEPDKMLDQFIWRIGDKLESGTNIPDNVDEFIYLRDRYTEHNKDLNEIARQVRSADGDITQEQVRARTIFYQKKADMRDESKWDTPIEKEAARRLLEYRTSKRNFGEYKVSDKSLNRWQTLKNKIDAKDDKALKKRWYEENVVRKYKQEYTDKSKDLRDRLNDLQDRVRAVRAAEGANVSNEAVKQKWAELTNLVSGARNNSYIIDGNLVDIKRAKDIELSIEEAKQEVEDIFRSGMTPADKAKRSALFAKMGELVDKSKILTGAEREDNSERIDIIKEQIEELKEKNKIDERFEEDHKDYLDLIKQMSELSENTPTPFFDKRYEDEFNAFVQQRGVEDLVDMSFEQMDEQLRDEFEKDTWYTENTIEKEKWEKITNTDDKGKETVEWNQYTTRVPIYPWRVSEPKDKKMIDSEVPSFSWAKYEVNEQYKNKPEDILDVTDNLKLKDFKNYNTDLTPAEVKYNKFLKKEADEAQSYYPKGQRLGDLIPSIERDISLFETTKDSASTLVEQVNRKFKHTEQDKDGGEDASLGDTSGKQVLFQPAYYIQDIDSAIVDRNIHETYLKYVQASSHYKVMNEIIPVYSSTKKILEKNVPRIDSNDIKVRSEINKLGDKVGSLLGVRTKLINRNSENNRLKVFNGLADMWIFGESSLRQDVTVNNKTYRFDKIHGTLLNAKSTTTMAALPVTVANGSLAVSGFPFASQFANLLGGRINQLVKTGIKNRAVSYSMRNANKGAGKFITEYSTQLISDYTDGRTGNKSFFGQITDLFGVFEDVDHNIGSEIKYTGTKGKFRRMTGDIFFFAKNSMEISLAGTTFTTLASEHFIRDDSGEFILNSKGQKINVLDAYDTPNKQLTLLYPNWGTVDNREFRNKLNKAKRDTDGAYATLDKSLLQRYWWGAALFWMGKFFVPFIENMYSAKRFSFEEGTHIQGYWRHTVSTIWEVGKYLKDSDTRNLNFIRSALDGDQKDSMRQFGIQLFAVSILYAALSALGYDDEDPERFAKMEKQAGWKNNLVFSILKAKTESESLFMPWGIEEIWRKKKNPIPQILPYSDNFKNLLWDDINYSRIAFYPFNDVDDEIFKRYKVDSGYASKGDIRAMIDVIKLAGYSNTKNSPISGVKIIEQFN